MPKINDVETDNVSITMSTALIYFLNKYCKRHELQKSQVVCKAVKRLLASAMADDPAFWEQLYDKENI